MPVNTNNITTTAANDRASFAIAIGDDEQPIDAAINISSIIIRKEINKISWARVSILDGDTAIGDFEQSDSDQFIPGKKITISLGFGDNITQAFKGLIVTHANRAGNYASETIVVCKDEAVKMTIAPKSKHYNNVTDSDVAEELIGNYGLTPDVESTTIVNKDLVQYNLTDWDFMVSRMDRLGKIVLVNDGTITIKKPDTSAASVLDVTYGANILDFQAGIESRNQISTVKVSSWDFQAQAVQTTESQFSAGTEEGNLSADDLASALNTNTLDLRSSAFLTEEERQTIADGRKMKDVLSKIRGAVKFEGDSTVNVGDVLNLTGVGDRFNGPAFVSAVKQEYVDGNWITEAMLGLQPEWFAGQVKAAGNTFVAGSSSANLNTGILSMMQGLQIGLVNDIEDPENEFRVQVKMPAINADEDGVWARIATLDAGNNRGTFFRPEVGDEVIVGFINNDPVNPIILGMLHSSAKPSPITPASNNNEKGLQTRSGIKLNFNDGDKMVKIETPSGKKITMSDNDALIKVEDENGNTISFDSSGVTVQSASDLNIKATGTLSLSGAQISISGNASVGIDATSVSVNGSGTTEIKGAIVKIN